MTLIRLWYCPSRENFLIIAVVSKLDWGLFFRRSDQSSVNAQFYWVFDSLTQWLPSQMCLKLLLQWSFSSGSGGMATNTFLSLILLKKKNYRAGFQLTSFLLLIIWDFIQNCWTQEKIYIAIECYFCFVFEASSKKVEKYLNWLCNLKCNPSLKWNLRYKILLKTLHI